MDILTAISAVFAVLSGAVALYQKIKAGQAESAYDQAQTTLAAIAVAVESVPMSENDRAKLKKNIQWLATQMDTEEEVLKPIVRQVTELAKVIRSNNQGTRLSEAEQKQAIAAWKSHKAPKKTNPAVNLLPSLFLLVVATSSCLPNRPSLVQTTVAPADEETPTLLLVTWPTGISNDPEDFVTTRTDTGLMVTIAPFEAGTPAGE